MDEMLLNDIRCVFSVLVLLVTAVYTVREATFTTIRRIRHVYLWTDIRRRQIMMVFFTVLCTSMVLYTFNDLQRMITAGTLASGWFDISMFPAKIYEGAIILAGVGLLSYNYILFGKRMVQKKEGTDNQQIMAEMVPLNVMALGIILAAIIVSFTFRFWISKLDKAVMNDGYGISACVRSGLCVAAVVYMIFDARLAKRQFIDIQTLEIESDKTAARPQIWKKEEIKTKEQKIDDLHYAVIRCGLFDRLRKFGLWKR